jgi:hypothetical protein
MQALRGRGVQLILARVVSVTPRPRFTPGERIPGTHWIGRLSGLQSWSGLTG